MTQSDRDRVDDVVQVARETFPLDAIAALRTRRDDVVAKGPSPTKYLDAPRWLRVCAQRAVALDLDVSQPKRVIDLGTGASYFPFICKALGHDAISTDWSSRSGVYREVTRAIGIHVEDLDVAPFVSLGIRDRFGLVDLVTSFMVTFNGHRATPWEVPEWEFFLDDCRRSLNAGGRVVLELNRESGGRCYSVELERWIRERATITGHWPHPPRRMGHRVVFAPK